MKLQQEGVGYCTEPVVMMTDVTAVSCDDESGFLMISMMSDLQMKKVDMPNTFL